MLDRTCLDLPRRALVALVAIAGALLASPACVIADDDDDDGRRCTLIGCGEGVLATFASRSGTWAPGEYRFEIDADGKAITCSATLPLGPCNQGSSNGRCDVASVEVQGSNCTQPAGPDALTHLAFFTDQPASIGVKITRDGATLADTRLTPNYVESRPNGAQCAPVCRGATPASVAIDLP